MNLPRNTLLKISLGRKKPARWAAPTGAAGGEASGRQDAVDMRVMDQRLSPGVQHAEEADLGAQMLGIGRHLQQRLRRQRNSRS